jgi:hypothetical protein
MGISLSSSPCKNADRSSEGELAIGREASRRNLVLASSPATVTRLIRSVRPSNPRFS